MLVFVRLCFFFFKQKTAYEMLRSLVGSEMCIRDSVVHLEVAPRQHGAQQGRPALGVEGGRELADEAHLSLIHI